MIELSNVEKEYADKLLFKNVNLTIYDGERVGIVGSNGSGKTTLLRIITGEVQPDEGQLYSNATIGYLKQITEYTHQDFLTMCLNPELIKDFMKIKKQLQISDDIEMNVDRLQALSGGEKTKLMLASILSQNPDTLILDEPTNHLDQNGIEWLIGALDKYNGTVIVVSHDRYFLNSVVNRIVEIENGTVNDFYGDYDDYNKQKEQILKEQKQRYEQQEHLKKKIDKQIKQLNVWAVKAEKESRRQGGMMSDSRIKGAQTKAQVSAGKLANQAKAKVSKLEQAKEDFIEKPYEEGDVFYKLDAKPIGSKILVRAENLTKAFGQTVLFEDATFNIVAGEKVSLEGKNGAGKTTLIKIILGHEDYTGSLWVAPALKPAYLSQDVLDLDGNMTVMELSKQGDKEYRTKFLSNLANMNMSRQTFDRKISTLSLGERMRIKLNEVILSDFNMLILDEPTNHLDLPNKIFMEKILKDYKGALLLVSHDRTLSKNVCESSLVFEENTIKKKQLSKTFGIER